MQLVIDTFWNIIVFFQYSFNTFSILVFFQYLNTVVRIKNITSLFSVSVQNFRLSERLIQKVKSPTE